MVESTFSLYFHVPFCTKKCDYCHFYVVPNQSRFVEIYLQALKKEWEQKLPLMRSHHLVSIYFGGGTPSLLPASALHNILQWIRQDFSLENVEITLETNPEQTSSWIEWRDLGINRVSVGVQSLQDSLLKILSRQHSSQQAKETIYAIHEAGIHNLSIDLMYDIPQQTLEDWQNSLDALSSLPFTHLSLYNLTFEPHTVFYKRRSQLQKSLPSSETSLHMLQMAIKKLQDLHFERYEISAFSLKNYASKHNTGYWQGRPFLGLGPSACSDWEDSRFRNTPHLHRWAKSLDEGLSPEDFRETLSPQARQKELFAVGLRQTQGVSLENFPAIKEDILPILDILSKRGWAEVAPTQIRLTEEGLLFHDTIAEEIVDPY